MEKQNIKPRVNNGSIGPNRIKNGFIIPALFLILAILSFSPKKDNSHPELPKPIPGSRVIIHTGYAVSYNPSFRLADWVAYELTAKETVSSVKRNDEFVRDPILTSSTITPADYKNSGYDMGHLAPAADICYSLKTMVESFYLSNVAPQIPEFNRGIWKKLEELVRQWANDDHAVYVVTGPVLSKGLPVISRDSIPVPAFFYKVVAYCTASGMKGIGFILPNRASREPLLRFAVSIDSVEKLTGIDFFYQMPSATQQIIESRLNMEAWKWTLTSNGRR